MKNKKELLFEAQDKFNDLSSMLTLAVDSINQIEQIGDDVKVNGVCTLLFHIDKELQTMSKDFRKVTDYKGEHNG